MKKRKIALLDLGGVVFRLFEKSNKAINWKIVWSLNEKYLLKEGGSAFPDFLIEYNKLTDQNLKVEEFLEKVFYNMEFNQKLVDFIKKERDIIIVSDNYRENINYISKIYDFESWSLKQVYSFDYKMCKSNPKFFKKLLEDIKEYEVKNLLLIDDSESKLESAYKNGINGIHYKNNEQTIREIEEYDRKNL